MTAMRALTFYFAPTKGTPRRHQPVKIDGKIVGYIRVTRSSRNITAEVALRYARPMAGETVLNTVEVEER